MFKGVCPSGSASNNCGKCQVEDLDEFREEDIELDSPHSNDLESTDSVARRVERVDRQLRKT